MEDSLREPTLCLIPPGQGLKSGGNAGCQHYSIPDGRFAFVEPAAPPAHRPKRRVDGCYPSTRAYSNSFMPQAEAFCDAQITLVVSPAQVGQHSAAVSHKL